MLSAGILCTSYWRPNLVMGFLRAEVFPLIKLTAKAEKSLAVSYCLVTLISSISIVPKVLSKNFIFLLGNMARRMNNGEIAEELLGLGYSI